VLSTRGAASAAAATVTVTAASEEKALRTVKVPGGQGDMRVAQVTAEGLKAGQYRAHVVVAVAEGAKVLGQETLDFEIRERPEWLGNRIGLIDYVPKPWTDLEYDGETVSCCC